VAEDLHRRPHLVPRVEAGVVRRRAPQRLLGAVGDRTQEVAQELAVAGRQRAGASTHGAQVASGRRKNLAALPQRMSACCAGLRKSAARIASTPATTWSGKSDPNMMRRPKPAFTSPRR